MVKFEAKGSLKPIRELRKQIWKIGEERWAAMPGWEDHANISDHGRVFITIRRVKANNTSRFKREIGGYYRKPRKLRGYLMVVLGGRKKKANVFIHKVTAKVFVPNPDGHKTVYHKDGNPENNHYTNLAWGTKADQQRAMMRGKYKVHPNSHGAEREVINRVYEIWRSLKNGETGKSIAARLGVCNATISKIRHRQAHTELLAMFDGTYATTGDKRADFTDKRKHRHDDERNPIIINAGRFKWEDNPPPIPTTEELNAVQQCHATDNIPFASEVEG